ncbi:hypothetical protein GCM10027445_12420 [Amycolatopsis endophytica]|uniref:Transmembrane protein n=1 Tax=Amycolatopsis endophytica TaxID=860233 RepID=A0A853B2Y3_9PSEU|nr:gephyrin-like molybdotransferase receptor GlpR [Amycolatopsis endophytica]NYI89379.1 hypothetical protein [Amycolatopsis endophytica]
MPSSLIIVALAAAWLVVLVPMVARKRQAVTRTADAELAARVVRSGGGADDAEEEFAMSESTQQVTEADDRDHDDRAEYDDVEEFEDFEEETPRVARESASERRYRPGRGGFDPEAAEIAARAKYAFRQRVVLCLFLVAIVTAAGAGFLTSSLWWLHGAVDLTLVGYLAYLRRQVRIEAEIRQRRMARLGSRPAGRPVRRERPVEDVVEPPREIPGVERRPSPAMRLRGSAVVVDLEDEDPAFHDLDDPDQLPFRRAVGE